MRRSMSGTKRSSSVATIFIGLVVAAPVGAKVLVDKGDTGCSIEVRLFDFGALWVSPENAHER